MIPKGDADAECCGVCWFFLLYADSDEWGGCRRYPPDWSSRLEMSQYRPVHPKTPACGEFHLRPEGMTVGAGAAPPLRETAEARPSHKTSTKTVSQGEVSERQ